MICGTHFSRISTIASISRLSFLRATRPATRFTCSRMASTLPKLPIFEAIHKHDASSIAIVHYPSGRSFTYGELVNDVANAAHQLKTKAQGKPLTGERVAFLVENGYDYVVTLLSIFANHSIAVPLCTTHPDHELKYIVDHSQALLLLSSEKFKDKAQKVQAGLDSKPLLDIEKIQQGKKSSDSVVLESSSSNDGGMMLYTSGTTSRPKGVVLPTSVLTAQCQSLLEAWKYTASDRLLHVLPLHHIHGTVNALLTPLFSGSTIEFMFPFNPQNVWDRFTSPFLSSTSLPKSLQSKITFFTVVPTIYNRLIQSHGTLPEETKAAVKEATNPANLRLNISGSAALPTPTKVTWSELTNGNVLLERYGMTEVGMALSCGLASEDRVDGSVGWPLPGVEARLVDTDTRQIIKPGEDVDENGKERQGEIQLRGPTIFREYWNNAKATSEEFVEGEDGKGRWFKTGDVAIRKIVNGAGQSSQSWAQGPMFFIQGRKSADIIKTGGEKVSALEVEREMLALPEVSEVAVVGLTSEAWGQKVAAVVVLTEQGKTAGKGGKAWSALDMRRAMKELLANYKIPQDMKIVDSIPRNAMGKINKKELVKSVFPDLSP